MKTVRYGLVWKSPESRRWVLGVVRFRGVRVARAYAKCMTTRHRIVKITTITEMV